MERGNTYTAIVTEETDFFEGWTDHRLPNMVFLYDQESLEDCEEINGVYYATYKTWVVTEPRQMEYVQPDGTHVVIDIPIGEYGKL
tara:strand:+ start:1014 stop:1271 length:258 start_codon:yes stop_codon:yes gene_type:complete